MGAAKTQPVGPIVLFDKRFVEMLNVDEEVVFEAPYSSVISPIFYIEVLTDLSKERPDAPPLSVLSALCTLRFFTPRLTAPL
jgi:hypothetical protein